MSAIGGRRGFAALGLTLILVLSACVTTNYKDQIVSFNKSFSSAADILATYYSDMNQFERDLYLTYRLYNKEDIFLRDKSMNAGTSSHSTGILEIICKEFDEERKGICSEVENLPLDKTVNTPLAGVFPEQSIRNRVKTINLLRIYFSLLANIAGGEGSVDLGSAVDDLASQFENLAKTMKDDLDKDLSGACNAIASLFKEWDKYQREKSLTTVIIENAKAIDNALDLIETDFKRVIERRRRTGEGLLLELHRHRHNCMLPSSKDCKNSAEAALADRKSEVEALNKAAKRKELFSIHSPSQLIAALKVAHASLLKWANSERSNGDIASLTMAMKQFDIEVQTFSEAAKKMQALK